MNLPRVTFDPDHSQRLPQAPEVGLPSAEMNARGRMDEASVGAGEGFADYRKLLLLYVGMALKHRWVIIACCLGGLGVGLAFTMTMPRIYEAVATIQIDPEPARVIKLNDVNPPAAGREIIRFYQTQYDLLKSRSLAERVVADLDLVSAKDLLQPQSASPWGKLSRLIFGQGHDSQLSLDERKSIALSIVRRGLKIEPVVNSSLVKIEFESQNPEWASRIANGVAQSYISTTLERRYGASSYAREFLKDRLDDLKVKLEESEKALVAYADQKEIITPEKDKGSLAESDLTALNTALQKTTTDRIGAQQVWEQASRMKGYEIPQILNDGSIQALRAKRAGLMSDYQEKLAIFKPAYPDMRKLKAQIDQVDEEINASANSIKHALKSRYEMALQEEQALRQKIDIAKRNVLDTRNKEIQYNILKREADTNRTLYEGLLQQYKDIGVAGAVSTNNVSLIDRAQMPGSPVSPVLIKNLLIAFVVSLLLSVVVIAVMEVLDDTFKSPEEVEEQLGLAVLGLIPYTDGDILLTLKSEPNSAVAEAYRSFRTALQFSTDQGAPKNLAVTSANPGEGKSMTAAALAMNFAQLGMKVLLIDADLRNPSQHRKLNRDNSKGLANYLAGAQNLAELLQATDLNQLCLMASGPLPPNPAELLAGPRMIALLAAASERFDTVIVDAPPVMGLADAPLLSSITAGTLLVMSNGDTRRGVIRAALKRLHFARARIIGAVLNKYDFRAASYGYGYGYGAGYGYGYGYGAMHHYGYGQQVAQVEHSAGK